jgi:hypothetical protein
MSYHPEEEVKERRETLGTADDHQEADNLSILTWDQAVAKAQAWYKAQVNLALRRADGEDIPSGAYTVKNAWEDYLRDCERRNVKGVKISDQTSPLPTSISGHLEFRDRLIILADSFQHQPPGHSMERQEIPAMVQANPAGQASLVAAKGEVGDERGAWAQACWKA